MLSKINRRLIGGQSAVNTDKAPIESKTTSEHILEFIKSNNKVTSSQLADFTELSQRRIREILSILIADEVIVKVGEYRYTHYEMKK